MGESQEYFQIENLEPNLLGAAAGIAAALPFFKNYGIERLALLSSLEAALAARNGSEIVGAFDGTALVGMAWLLPEAGLGRAAYLRLLAVAESHQGRGVGRRLLKTLEQSHLQRGGMLLLVTEDNLLARGFYEHLGYRLAGCLPSFLRPGRDECIYFKPPSRELQHTIDPLVHSEVSAAERLVMASGPKRPPA